MMETDGTLSEISLSDFEKAIGGNIEEALIKNETSHEVLLFYKSSVLINSLNRSLTIEKNGWLSIRRQ